MKYLRKIVTGSELSNFYEDLFRGTNTNYGFFSYPHTFCPIPWKEIFLPLPFLKIINTKPMQMAGLKIQTAHSYKEHPRMEDTRLDHMVFAQSLGVDLLTILEKKGYEIDNKTKIAFLIFLLTHDIGHGPFSHPFEQMVNGYKGMHEDIGKRTLKEDKELHEILESIYPGLTDRVIHFKDYDEYGLSSLLEGTFDLDRAAFLIMDTFLMDGEDKSDSFYDIVDSVYKIFDSIILKSGKVYYDYNCFREMDDFIRIRKENYEVYQSPKRALSDLLLKRIGEKAPIVVATKQNVFRKLPISIQEEISFFLKFIEDMKREKENISLEEYYSFGDIHFERIFRLLLLLDDPSLSRDCKLISTSTAEYERYYQIEINKEQSGEEDFYIDNKFTIYKSTPGENILFLMGEEEIDYKNCAGRLVEGDVFFETVSYTLKHPPVLFSEFQKREKLIQEVNEEFVGDKFLIEQLTPGFPSDEDIIRELRRYLDSVQSNISLVEHAKFCGMSINQLYAYLFMYTSNPIIHRDVSMLLSDHLGYYFKEEETFFDSNDNLQKIKSIWEGKK